KEYLLVCMDYVTKWAKVQALAFANEDAVADFLYNWILLQFGAPRAIVSDQ
ncbi:hypothetical protein KI387_036851, partial [Taxus chinensis]